MLMLRFGDEDVFKGFCPGLGFGLLGCLGHPVRESSKVNTVFSYDQLSEAVGRRRVFLCLADC